MIKHLESPPAGNKKPELRFLLSELTAVGGLLGDFIQIAAGVELLATAALRAECEVLDVPLGHDSA